MHPLPLPLHYLQANEQTANGGKNGKTVGTNYSVRINQNQYKKKKQKKRNRLILLIFHKKKTKTKKKNKLFVKIYNYLVYIVAVVVEILKQLFTNRLTFFFWFLKQFFQNLFFFY